MPLKYQPFEISEESLTDEIDQDVILPIAYKIT